ncbi:uncharacterized protein LOC119590154 [Penaeus monodon]|uniref:uncharacterized protein LOC119590154 n=1 Tax=Penaeus monodon TaxID=6687 RepID=UPI0018A7722F|nr:uncharacterized protein LOC119590154 [Penaeus monodon]
MAVSKKDAVCQRKRFYKEKLVEILEEKEEPIERSVLLRMATKRHGFSNDQRNSMDQALEAMLTRGTAELVCLGDKQHVQLIDKDISVNIKKKKKPKGKKGKAHRFRKEPEEKSSIGDWRKVKPQAPGPSEDFGDWRKVKPQAPGPSEDFEELADPEFPAPGPSKDFGKN